MFFELNRKVLSCRRQHPFKDYILDFFCYRVKLVIELDGQHHKSNLEYDSDRTSIIESYGLKVIRFDNDEIDNNFDNVKEKLMKFLKADDNFPSL
ncbi:MAG: endonuclease domain-containing protein [Maribacter sp.]|nr:endonuclease domain-containing protein [Maribacter sp.]